MNWRGSVYNNEIPGYMAEDELLWLMDTCEKMESVVEVGSWKGKSTHAILTACKGTVYAVDHFQGCKDQIAPGQPCWEATYNDVSIEFMNNVGHFPNLKLIKKESTEAAKEFQPKSVDLVFIDDGHTFADVMKDLVAWTPIAKKIISGHDYVWGPEVKKAVDEFYGGRVRHIRTCMGIWAVDII